MVQRIHVRNGVYTLIDDEDSHLCGPSLWLVRGYVMTKGDGLLHRLIMRPGDGEIVDHIDGDPLNNTRANLRICTHAENMRNRRMHRNNRCGRKGVYLEDRPGRVPVWRAGIRVGGRKICLGSFKSIDEAAAAYERAAIKYHGEFARIA